MSNRRGTNTPKPPRPRTRSELRATAVARRAPRTIPLVWLSSVIAFFLLAPAWISTLTFFTCFRHAALHHRFWASEEFWFFGLGAVLWVIVFFSAAAAAADLRLRARTDARPLGLGDGGTGLGFPRLANGRAYRQRQAQLLDRAGALFFPALLHRGHRGLRRRRRLFTNMEPYHRWLYALIGVTWAFHVSFTLWMIPKGQTDLSYYGTFFSLVIIYLMNLAVLTVLLIIASPHVTWRGFGLEWLRNAHALRAMGADRRAKRRARRWLPLGEPGSANLLIGLVKACQSGDWRSQDARVQVPIGAGAGFA